MLSKHALIFLSKSTQISPISVQIKSFPLASADIVPYVWSNVVERKRVVYNPNSTGARRQVKAS